MVIGKSIQRRKYQRRYNENKKNGLCIDCGNNPPEEGKGRCRVCLDKRKIYKSNRKEKCKYSVQNGSTTIETLGAYPSI